MFLKCKPGWHIQTRTVENYDLTYIVKGGARYMINDTSHDLESGDLLCLNEGDMRSAVTPPNNLMQCYSVQFKTVNEMNPEARGGYSQLLSA
jgi:hypothetical protein